MKSYILLGMTSISILVLSCQSTAVVERRPAPPLPVVVKVRPGQPSANYVWVNGNYVRRGGRYVYRQGYWTLPPSYGQRYVDGYWQKRRGNYIWVPGYWTR